MVRTTHAPWPGIRFARLICSAIAATLVGGCARCSPNLRPPPEIAVDAVRGFHNPEDVEFIESEGLVLVSNGILTGGGAQRGMGRLTALDASTLETRSPFCMWPRGREDDFHPGDLGDPQCRAEVPPECYALLAQRFSPHGIASLRWNGVVRVGVVNHRPELFEVPPACAAAFDGRDAIDLFEMVTNDRETSGDRPQDERGKKTQPTLSWRGCVRMPEGTRGNDLSFDPTNAALVVGNAAPAGLLSWVAGFVFRVGDLRRWDGVAGWSTIPGSESHNPNSVVVTEGFVYFTASTSGEVWRLPRTGSTDRTEMASICVGGLPDNLSLTPRGNLLVATHTHVRRFAHCVGKGCASPWAAYELHPGLVLYRPIIANDGSGLSLVSSVALVGSDDEETRRLVFGSVTGGQIGIANVPPPSWEEAH